MTCKLWRQTAYGHIKKIDFAYCSVKMEGDVHPNWHLIGEKCTQLRELRGNGALASEGMIFGRKYIQLCLKIEFSTDLMHMELRFANSHAGFHFLRRCSLVDQAYSARGLRFSQYPRPRRLQSQHAALLDLSRGPTASQFELDARR